MYIRVMDKNMPLTVSNHQCVEKLTLGMENKWMRDDKGALHIANRNNKYNIIIKCEGIIAPYVSQECIGSLCEIISQTRLYEYVENGKISRKYQNGTLGKHASSENVAPVRTYDKVNDVQEIGVYSYHPIIEAYLRSVEITNDGKSIHWMMIFEEK